MLQASSAKRLEVLIPSDDLTHGVAYVFTLRVDTILGGSAEAAAEVFKSSEVRLMSKVSCSKAVGVSDRLLAALRPTLHASAVPQPCRPVCAFLSSFFRPPDPSHAV